MYHFSEYAHTEARRGRAKAGKGATYIEEVKRGKSFCCVNRRLLVGGGKGALVGGAVREVVLDPAEEKTCGSSVTNKL